MVRQAHETFTEVQPSLYMYRVQRYMHPGIECVNRPQTSSLSLISLVGYM